MAGSKRLTVTAAGAFLAALALDSDIRVSEVLDPALRVPTEGAAAWARAKLGLTVAECADLSGPHFWDALDDHRSGMDATGAAYVVLRLPRNRLVHILVRDAGDHYEVTPDAKFGARLGARILLKRPPKAPRTGD